MKLLRPGIIGLLATAVVAPFFVRRRMRVFQRKFVAAPPEVLFPYLNDLRNWPLWRAWNERAECHAPVYSDPSTGVGATQHFETSTKGGLVRIETSTDPERLSYLVDFGPDRAPIEGIFSLRPVGRGTWLDWMLKWPGQEVPVARYADLLRMIRYGRRMRADLAELARIVETDGGGAVGGWSGS